MRYVTRVKSNLRAGVDVELSEKTLIVGVNGSGKSSVVNAVELALTGKASDVFGRTVMAETNKLVQHFGGGKDGLWAEAEIDGQLVRWEAGGRGKASGRHLFDNAVLDPETAFPLRPLREAVLGSPETMRKFFLQHAAGAASMADVEAMIPESLRVHFKRALASHSWVRGTPAVDMLLAVLEHAKKSAREAKNRAEGAREAGNLQGQGLPPPPTGEALAAAKARLTEARAALERAVGVQARSQAGADVAGRLAEAEANERGAFAKFEELQAKYKAEKAWLDEHPSPASLSDEQKALIKVLDWHVAIDADACRTCGTKFASGARLQGQASGDPRAFPPPFEERARRAHEMSDATMEAARTHAGHVEAAQEIFREAQSVAADYKRARGVADALRSAMGDVSMATGEAADSAVTALRLTVAGFETDVRQLESAATAWSASKRSIELALSEEREQGAWAQLADECVAAVGRLLDAGVGAFVKRVQAFLPASDLFELRLREGTRGACDFGFVRNGELHTALSGAEWARETCAMAAACMSADQKIHVLVPPPAEFDPDTLANVMEAFLPVDAQVIVTAPLWPSRVVHGWRVVDLGSDASRAVGAALRFEPRANGHAADVGDVLT